MGQPGRVLIQGTGPLDDLDSFDPTSGCSFGQPALVGRCGPGHARHGEVLRQRDQRGAGVPGRGNRRGADIANPRRFAAASGAKLLSEPGCSSGLFGMNTTVAPWNNIDVRRAVAYALNRADIIAAIGGNAEPESTLIPPGQLSRSGSQAQISACR